MSFLKVMSICNLYSIRTGQGIFVILRYPSEQKILLRHSAYLVFMVYKNITVKMLFMHTSVMATLII